MRQKPRSTSRAGRGPVGERIARPVIALAIALGAVFLLAGRPAGAEPSPPSLQGQEPGSAPGVLASKPSPWSEGVSAQQRALAQQLVDEAFAFHDGYEFEQAAATYNRALGHWNHPAIHYSLGRIYMSLFEPVKAYEALSRAVRHGPAPLDPDDYREARKQLDRLRQLLSELVIECDEPDAHIVVNGDPWSLCPGHESRVVLPGRYVVEVAKSGYFTASQTVPVLPGQRLVLAPRLVSVSDGQVIERRWPRWQPWAVVGLGVAASALGASLSGRVDSGQGRALSLALTGVGGAALTGGAALVYLNRPRTAPVTDRSQLEHVIQPFGPGPSGAAPAGVSLSLGGSF